MQNGRQGPGVKLAAPERKADAVMRSGLAVKTQTHGRTIDEVGGTPASLYAINKPVDFDWQGCLLLPTDKRKRTGRAIEIRAKIPHRLGAEVSPTSILPHGVSAVLQGGKIPPKSPALGLSAFAPEPPAPTGESCPCCGHPLCETGNPLERTPPRKAISELRSR